jgi:hypothetical protein
LGITKISAKLETNGNRVNPHAPGLLPAVLQDSANVGYNHLKPPVMDLNSFGSVDVRRIHEKT